MIAAATVLYLLAGLYAFSLIKLARGLTHASDPQNRKQPKVSAVVAARNESANIISCLRCLQNQDYPADLLEIVVVNDRSEDDTGQLVADAARLDSRITLLEVHDRIPAIAPKKHAIDLAVHEARGDLILTTDADCRPGSSWISQMVRYFEPEVGMVAGYNPYDAGEARSATFQKLLALDYFAMACVAAATSRLGFPVSCSGGNLAYRTQVYSDVGGFGAFKAHPSGDDDLFLQRVREMTNWKIRYATAFKSHVPTAPPATLREFIQQRLRYASKSRLYSWRVSLALLAVYLMNFGLTLAPVLLISGVGAAPLWAGALTAKIGAEFIFLRRGARLFATHFQTRTFVLASVFHPVYIAVIGLMAQFVQFDWKGEKHTDPAAIQSFNKR